MRCWYGDAPVPLQGAQGRRRAAWWRPPCHGMPCRLGRTAPVLRLPSCRPCFHAPPKVGSAAGARVIAPKPPTHLGLCRRCQRRERVGAGVEAWRSRAQPCRHAKPHRRPRSPLAAAPCAKTLALRSFPCRPSCWSAQRGAGSPASGRTRSASEQRVGSGFYPLPHTAHRAAAAAACQSAASACLPGDLQGRERACHADRRSGLSDGSSSHARDHAAMDPRCGQVPGSAARKAACERSPRHHSTPTLPPCHGCSHAPSGPGRRCATLLPPDADLRGCQPAGAPPASAVRAPPRGRRCRDPAVRRVVARPHGCAHSCRTQPGRGAGWRAVFRARGSGA